MQSLQWRGRKASQILLGCPVLCDIPSRRAWLVHLVDYLLSLWTRTGLEINSGRTSNKSTGCSMGQYNPVLHKELLSIHWCLNNYFNLEITFSRFSTEFLLTEFVNSFVFQITKKLNFPPDQPIFKNLIPINVNDSLLISSEEPKPFRKKYVAKTNKDPVPELSDFLTPIPPLEHVIPLEDKPLIQLRPNNDFYKSVLELHLNFHPDS